jgi:hypothetical protein
MELHKRNYSAQKRQNLSRISLSSGKKRLKPSAQKKKEKLSNRI